LRINDDANDDVDDCVYANDDASDYVHANNDANNK
jgi:hypothetical protein